MWSSDILPTWDTLKRQVPTGLGFAAAGMAYWTNDIGGWEYLPAKHVPKNPPLLDPSDARANVGGYDDYPELYARWFQYAAFLPIFRAHGSRVENEVWSYGKQAEPVLVKYLKLRYELMPYVYSLAHRTRETGAPYMRALFMDFPGDPKVADLRDEYMFGPAFLVAPVTEQGATHRSVYLPAGSDWFDYWTNERVEGRADGRRRRSDRHAAALRAGGLDRALRHADPQHEAEAGGREGARLRRRERRARALRRRRPHVRLREGRGPGDTPALGRPRRPADARRPGGLDRLARRDRRSGGPTLMAVTAGANDEDLTP